MARLETTGEDVSSDLAIARFACRAHSFGAPTFHSDQADRGIQRANVHWDKTSHVSVHGLSLPAQNRQRHERSRSVTRNTDSIAATEHPK